MQKTWQVLIMGKHLIEGIVNECSLRKGEDKEIRIKGFISILEVFTCLYSHAHLDLFVSS